MSTAELLKPIMGDGIRSVNFFNGRLLSAEDLTREQEANREKNRMLGRAIGDGVAYGLEVSRSAGSGTVAIVRVEPGLAINRNGEALRLSTAVDLSLVRPQEGGNSTVEAGFSVCTPIQSGVYVSGSGVYLLTMSPAKATEGRAPVSGLQSSSADCNTKYRVDSVQFRLVQLDLTTGELNDQNHLRSLVAYKCFGIAQLKSRFTAPFSATAETYGLLDQLRPNSLTDCDVPLAILLWSATQGIQFVDVWAVKRRLMEPPTTDEWTIAVGDRRRSEAEATLLQFQDQLDSIHLASALGGIPAAQIAADQFFTFLPPAGLLPTGNGGFDWKTFLGPHAPDQHTLIDEGLFRSALHRSLFQDPIKIGGFTLAAQANVAPPIPINVYRLPGETDFVMFARSWNGRIRVFLNPSPAANASVDIGASSRTANTQFNAADVAGAMRPIVDVPAGPYRLNVSVQGYQPVPPVEVDVIGGETIDIGIPIVRLPNGNIALTVIDESGTSIADKVSSVTVESVLLGNPVSGKRASEQWLLGDLKPGTYNVTVAAPGFRPNTLTGIPVLLGETVRRTVTMIRATGVRPPLCIGAANIKRPILQKARLCLVLTSRVSTVFTEAPLSMKRTTAGPGRIFREDFELEVTRAQEVVTAGGLPWSAMVQLEPVSADVAKWLAAWQEWFSKQHPGQGIEDAKPVIFINPRYVTPKGLLDVPDKPQAYAVFGQFARPMTVNISTNTTVRPVPAVKAAIRGIGDDDWAQLQRYGIKYVDQAAGLWSEFITAVTGQSLDYGRYLILDAISAVDKANKSRTYYEGWDSEVETAINDMKLTDDVAIANADRAVLSRRLGSGFANRLIDQSREVVPPEAWSLESIGISKGQVEALAVHGIGSKGELVGSTDAASGRTKVAEIMEVDAGQMELARNTAIAQMTSASIAFAPVLEITSLAGVNAAVSEKLGAANVASTETLAIADKTELASKTGLSVDAAAGLIESAKTAESERLVLSLSTVTSTSVGVLKTKLDSLGIRTLADLATKDTGAIAQALGGDVSKATAVISGVKLSLSVLRR